MGTGLRPYYDSLRAAGLIDADFAFINGTLYDTISGRVVTPGAASRLQRNGLATDLTTNNISSGNVLQNVTEGTVMCLCTPRAISAGVPAESLCFASDMATVDAADGFILGTRGTLGTIRFAASTVAGLNVTAEGAASSFVLGKKAWFSGTFKNNDAVKVFLNGVESGSASYAGKTKSNGGTLYIGNRTGVSRRIAGLYARLVSIKSALTEAQQQTLQAELDDTVYESNNLIINKDYPTIGSSVWEARYGMLADELTMSAGKDIGQLASLKVSSGTHKASSFHYNGVPAKGIKCVTAGDIILPDTIPDKGTTWVYRYYDDSAGAWETRTSASATVSLDAVNDLILWCDINSQNYLYKY